MHPITLPIDESGRITLPEAILSHLGVHPSDAVVLELNPGGAYIKSKIEPRSITGRIAEMNLPVADWEQMKEEIEAGGLR